MLGDKFPIFLNALDLIIALTSLIESTGKRLGEYLVE